MMEPTRINLASESIAFPFISRRRHSFFTNILRSLSQDAISFPSTFQQFIDKAITGDILSIDEAHAAALKIELESNTSLAQYRSVKSFDNISKEYTWASTHVGRPFSRHMSRYLDDDCPSNRIVNKLLARADALPLNTNLLRRHAPTPAEDLCTACNLHVPETLLHFMTACPAHQQDRQTCYMSISSSLDREASRVSRALLHSYPSSRYFAGTSNQEKLNLMLGDRTGSFAADEAIDVAVKRYLNRALARRQRANDSAWLLE